MNRTRPAITVAEPDLLPPHFDEEATLVGARPVVPLARALAAERSWVSPVVGAVLFGAMLMGVAGAIGINYYETRDRSQFFSGNQIVRQRAANQETADSRMISDADSGREAASANTTSVAASHLAQSESPSTQSQLTSPDSAGQSKGWHIAKSENGIGTRANQPRPSTNDFARLLRKRRVQSADVGRQIERPTGNKKHGAGRIQEIFEGPNP